MFECLEYRRTPRARGDRAAQRLSQAIAAAIRLPDRWCTAEHGLRHADNHLSVRREARDGGVGICGHPG